VRQSSKAIANKASTAAASANRRSVGLDFRNIIWDFPFGRHALSAVKKMPATWRPDRWQLSLN
jgi:hypothetical protein